MLAKAPVPGRVKTRLCPPCTPAQAADIAEASLVRTLEAALGSGATRVLLALDGEPGPWCPPGVALVPQGTGLLDRRLATAWSAAGSGPALQIGMDTPQVTATDLDRAMAVLDDPGTDAVLGPAFDGGWWSLGLRDPAYAPAAVLGIPASRPDTGAQQRARLVSLGLAVADLWMVRDIDEWDDVLAVLG